MAFTFPAAKAGYANLWRRAKVKRPEDAAKAAKRILSDRERYEDVAARIGHPDLWPLIGALHDREAAGSFAGVLHNGEKIIGTGRKTRLVPAGRGPFSSWEEAAEDALRLKGWHQISAWPIERWLYEAERFNGWGYVNRGVNSPYVWGGTSEQQPGKYVADHVWDARTVDKQLGVAAVLKAVFSLESDASPESDVPPKASDVPHTDNSQEFVRYLEDKYVILTKEQFAILLRAIRGS